MTLTFAQRRRLVLLLSAPLSTAVTNSQDKSLAEEQREAYLQEVTQLRELVRAITTEA